MSLLKVTGGALLILLGLAIALDVCRLSTRLSRTAFHLMPLNYQDEVTSPYWRVILFGIVLIILGVFLIRYGVTGH